jgi:5,10-methenyltetrahydrofolate synthetase
MEPDEAATWPEIKQWRKTQRAELVARREAVPEETRAAWNEAITRCLLDGFDVPHDAVIGYCWPYKGEFDARFAVRKWREQGATAALPEVTESKAPLQFRKWWPGAPMKPGVYDIPVPDGTELVVPDVSIVPMNAFDGRGYRLGYGGGFFDRTLAAVGRRTIAIGVSYDVLRVPSIYPQTHDVPMDFVVTESGIHRAGGEPLVAIDAAECRRRFGALLAARGLPRAAYSAAGYSSPACYAAEFPEYFGGDPEANIKH